MPPSSSSHAYYVTIQSLCDGGKQHARGTITWHSATIRRRARCTCASAENKVGGKKYAPNSTTTPRPQQTHDRLQHCMRGAARGSRHQRRDARAAPTAPATRARLLLPRRVGLLTMRARIAARARLIWPRARLIGRAVCRGPPARGKRLRWHKSRFLTTRAGPWRGRFISECGAMHT